MTTKELRVKRFREVIANLKSNKISQITIAKKMGKTGPYFNSVLSGVRGLTIEFLEIFINAFPEININYIVNGEGPMFLTDKSPNITELNEPSAPIYETKSVSNSNIQHKTYPLSVFNLDEQMDNKLTKSAGELSFPGSQNCDFAVYIHGEAMRGAICNGGGIAVKEIFNKDIIPFGHIYLVQTDDIDFVRYIKKSDDKDKICLHAHNDEEFQDFDIPRTSINRLFLVRKILNHES